MSKSIMSHLPWIVPTAAILAVGTGLTDRINISFGAPESGEVAQPAIADAAQVTPAQAAVAAVMDPADTVAPAAVAPDAPANVADQLAALLTEEAAEQAAQEVDVSRNAGFSIDVLETATEAALDEGTAVSASPDVQEPAAVTPAAVVASDAPVDADFFSVAQANLAAANSCINDLRNLASQAKVYFPSGGLTGEASGIAQARLIGTIAARCQGISIEVQGHSDASGDPAINLRLSQERAESVIARISAAGIDTSKFFAVGLGSASPSGIVGAQPAAYYDRRVEFTVVETTQTAALSTSTFNANTPNSQLAACVVGLQNAVAQTQIGYAPGSVTVSQEDFATALQLAQMAVACPQARLRVVGQHADQIGSVEDSATGRLRAIALMTTLVGAGVDASQIIMAAPGNSRPAAGLSNSRVDFDVILEDS